jgi:sigma-B regulation protein RsbU (phosphoserine phosphatase)
MVDSRDHSSAWSALLSPRRHAAEEQRALEHLLTSWIQDHRATSAAAYVRTRGSHRKVVAVGELELGDDPIGTQTATDSLHRLELPGGVVLVHDGDQTSAQADTTASLLLASAFGLVSLKATLGKRDVHAMSQGIGLVALYETGLAIASILDLELLGQEVLSRALLLLDGEQGAMYQRQGDVYRLVAAEGEALKEVIVEQLPPDAFGVNGGDAVTGLLPGAALVVAAVAENEGEPIGLLVVAPKVVEGVDRRAVWSDGRRVLSLFANQVAIALEKARLHKVALQKERLDHELRLAAQIQQQLLPSEMPHVEGFDILGWTQPARVVGGDYFTFRDLGQTRHAVVIADVSGKGTPAALLVSTLDSVLRVLLEESVNLEKLAVTLNHHILELSSANRYITMVLATLDPATGLLTYMNAGHNPGLVVRRNGTLEELGSGGPPIGLMPDLPFAAASIQLARGDTVCLYSDGITECTNRSGEDFGLERLSRLILQNRGDSLQNIGEVLNRAVLNFAQGQEQGDDQTVILMRREPEAG